ncbi:MAG: immunoglobulin domain-containing protein [Verrucomicrobiae bacterium]|nr:immunoglobulin domain-containing protein [Verrucomicrobiae bacterium]
MAQAQVTYTPIFTNIWVVAAGAYADLPSDANNRVRGIAINPVTTNVLYASNIGGTNNGTAHVSTLSFASGSNFVGNLNASGITSGTLAVDSIRVADDGAVYACNLSGSSASAFKIYRWASDTDVSTAPATVVNITSPSFTERLGDYMDVRGSGLNTEIVVVGNGSSTAITTNFMVFRPTDASCLTFTNFSILIPGSSASVNLCGAGVAFEGTNNVIWVRQAGSQNTRRVVYNPGTLTATVTATNTVDQSVCQGLKYFSATNGVQMLATVQATTSGTSPNIARVFVINTNAPLAAFASVLSSNLPPPYNANGNGLGNVDVRDGYLVFGAPGNGLSFFKLGFLTTAPPAVTISGSGSTFVAGFGLNAVFSGAASGSTPLSYQWYFNNGVATNPIVGALANSYTVTNVQAANAGSYFVIVTNLYGKATSGVVNITVLPNGGSSLASNLWSLAPGSRDYLTTGDNQRGLGYDTNLNRVVVVTRSPTNGILLLDGNTGADVGNLDISAFAAVTLPGALAFNMCGVADDGAVYVANLITSADADSSDSFVIYRWTSADPSATVYQSYAGNPLWAVGGTGTLGRIGDTMAVRGAGANTEILCTFRNGTNVALFTTDSGGVDFTCHIIAITNLAASIGAANPFTGASPLGLGCAFGAGNTFWAKSTSYNLRQVSFDLNSGMGAVIGSYAMPTTVAPLGVDVANGYIGLIGVTETPMNLSIYDITTPSGPTINTIVDREAFGANNVNGNGTGSVVFDVAGGRIFSLSSNSGLLALTYAPRLYVSPQVSGATVSWTGPGALQSATVVNGPYNNTGATSPYTSTAADHLFFRVVR